MEQDRLYVWAPEEAGTDKVHSRGGNPVEDLAVGIRTCMNYCMQWHASGDAIDRRERQPERAHINWGI